MAVVGLMRPVFYKTVAVLRVIAFARVVKTKKSGEDDSAALEIHAVARSDPFSTSS